MKHLQPVNVTPFLKSSLENRVLKWHTSLELPPDAVRATEPLIHGIVDNDAHTAVLVSRFPIVSLKFYHFPTNMLVEC